MTRSEFASSSNTTSNLKTWIKCNVLLKKITLFKVSTQWGRSLETFRVWFYHFLDHKNDVTKDWDRLCSSCVQQTSDVRPTIFSREALKRQISFSGYIENPFFNQTAAAGCFLPITLFSFFFFFFITWALLVNIPADKNCRLRTPIISAEVYETRSHLCNVSAVWWQLCGNGPSLWGYWDCSRILNMLCCS